MINRCLGRAARFRFYLAPGLVWWEVRRAAILEKDGKVKMIQNYMAPNHLSFKCHQQVVQLSLLNSPTSFKPLLFNSHLSFKFIHVQETRTTSATKPVEANWDLSFPEGEIHDQNQSKSNQNLPMRYATLCNNTPTLSLSFFGFVFLQLMTKMMHSGVVAPSSPSSPKKKTSIFEF